MSATNSTVCRNFLRGKCKHGARCRYQHIGGTSGTPHTAHNSKNKGKKRNDSSNQRVIHNVDVQSNLSSLESPEDCDSKDTTTCSVLQRGTCDQGEQSNFAHNSDTELVNGVESSPSDASAYLERQRKERSEQQASSSHRIKKGELPCPSWKSGSCAKGEKCFYAHDPEVQEAEGRRMETERIKLELELERRHQEESIAKSYVQVQEAEERRMETERIKLELELERRQQEEFVMDLPRLAREAEEQREEEERQRQEEARRWEETERQRRDEAKRYLEEARRWREEETRRRREEEQCRREEEERCRKEEQERRQREDVKQRLDEARKQREEEQRQREEEETRQRQEEARQRRVKEARRRLEEEQHKKKEEQRKREEEQRQKEEEARQQREEVRRRREAERCRQEEQQRRQEEEQRCADQQRRVADAQATIQRVVLAGSIVTFSSGLAIENTITGFESCRIRVKNIPRNARENEIAHLFTQQGLNKFEFHVVSVMEMPGRNGKQEADIVTNADVAQSLAIGLEGQGLEFRDERLEFEVGVFNAPGAMDALTPRDENTLTISCRAPSVRYVVEYPDIPFCRTKVAELNGRICAGRRVKVEMNQLPPGRVVPSFRPNTIKISNLPDVVPPAIVTDFTQSHLIRPLKPLSFDIDSAIRSLQLHINRIEGVEIESFDVISRGNNEAGILSIRARFNTWDNAKKVHDALLDRRFSYICNSMFWLRIAPQALYTITIPSGQYRAQETLWEELQGNIKDRKACNIIIRELNGGDYRIQVSGTIKAALGALKVRVENLAAGEKIDGWHDHLTYPQVHLVQKITEAGAFLRSDYWKRTLKLYGEPKAVEKAKTVVMEELKRLASLEVTVTLQRPSVGYFARIGLAAMREVFGEENVTLDIRSAEIMVRGGEEVQLHLNNHITESLKPINVNVALGSHTCPVCYDEVSTPFQLVCEHVYCTGCIRHFLTSAAKTGSFPLVCMGNESTCGTPISIPVIQKFLPPTAFDHLLETVFTTHVDKRPQEFRYCKTPDCMQIYRRSEAVSVLRCPSCFSEICSSCGEDSHERMSCEYARIHNNPAEQERMSEIWLLQRRDIKQCPTCSRLLEKTEGCNHMTCPCGAHICWRCMGVFDTTNIYDHMGTVHGSIDAGEPEAPRVAPGQYDQDRFEQDRIALYHAEAMEQRRREEVARVAQEQRDQIRRDQERIAAEHAEAIERRRREDEQERQREERAAQWRRQQAEWQ